MIAAVFVLGSPRGSRFNSQTETRPAVTPVDLFCLSSATYGSPIVLLERTYLSWCHSACSACSGRLQFNVLFARSFNESAPRLLAIASFNSPPAPASSLMLDAILPRRVRGPCTPTPRMMWLLGLFLFDTPDCAGPTAVREAATLFFDSCNRGLRRRVCL